MIKKTILLICLTIYGITLAGQSNELLIEQLKTQVNKAKYTEGRQKALTLALMGYDYIAPGDPQLQQLLYETYYATSADENYYEEGYEDAFNASDWSPKGKQLAVALSNGSIRLYNSSFREFDIFHHSEEQSVLDVDFSPDGKLLAYSDISGKLEILSLATGNSVQLWEHTDYIRSIEWSHDGRKLAAAGDENILYVYDAQNGERLNYFEGHTDWIRNVSWSADDRLIATASDDATMAVWSIENNALIISHTDHTDYCRDVAFAPKGKTLLSCSDDMVVYQYDSAADRAPAKKMEEHEEWVMAIDWSDDGKNIATANNGGTIILYANKTGEQTYYNSVLSETAWIDIDFSPNNRKFAVTSMTEVAIYEIGDSEPLARIFVEHEQSSDTPKVILEDILSDRLPTAIGLYFSIDKKKLALLNSDYQLEVIDMTNGHILYAITQHEDWIRNIAWSNDGQYLATASDDMMVGIWDAETGEILHFLSGHTDWVRDVDFSTDSKTLLSVGDEGVIRSWDVATGDELGVSEKVSESSLMTVDWSPGQDYIASQDSEGFLNIWQASNNKLLFTGDSYTQEGSVKWIDDKNLTVVDVDGGLLSWNAKEGMFGGSENVDVTSSKGVTATAKGLYISTSGAGQSAFLQGHIHTIIGMKWSPDGDYLISYASDNMMGVWEPQKNHLIALIPTASMFNKEIFWLSDNRSFLVAGSPKITLPASGIRDDIEKSGMFQALVKEDIIAYDLEKIFLNKEAVLTTILQKADASRLNVFADFYEERANLRPQGAARISDEEKAKQFREAAENQ